jgi:hypothetical protein
MDKGYQDEAEGKKYAVLDGMQPIDTAMPKLNAYEPIVLISSGCESDSGG